tara:strand:- start:812 stop:1150 length:339 start_codon:yes stop_codon:yes gene_type:complete
MKIELNSHNFNSIIVNEKDIIYLADKIESFLVFNKTLIVLFKIEESRNNYSQNVCAFDENGNEIWRIKSDNSKNRYVGINRENNYLVAINFSTNALILNPENGDILKEEWRK